MNDDDIEFECDACGVMFRGTLFGIDREYNKVIYGEQSTEVAVRDSETSAGFCSLACRNLARAAALRREGVPERRVGIEPIEPCAKCGGPVDMADWHLTFVESDIDFSSGCGQVLDLDYLAVVCKRCDGQERQAVEAKSDPEDEAKEADATHSAVAKSPVANGS